ncbi:hypothetical protein, partial [Methylobacterium gnaphalii]
MRRLRIGGGKGRLSLDEAPKPPRAIKLYEKVGADVECAGKSRSRLGVEDKMRSWTAIKMSTLSLFMPDPDPA